MDTGENEKKKFTIPKKKKSVLKVSATVSATFGILSQSKCNFTKKVVWHRMYPCSFANTLEEESCQMKKRITLI